MSEVSSWVAVMAGLTSVEECWAAQGLSDGEEKGETNVGGFLEVQSSFKEEFPLNKTSPCNLWHIGSANIGPDMNGVG